MKTTYHKLNLRKEDFPLRKISGSQLYVWCFGRWAKHIMDVDFELRNFYKPSIITEEEAFRYILEN